MLEALRRPQIPSEGRAAEQRGARGGVGCSEDKVSEERLYIPGDKLEFDLGSFEHEQHIDKVRVIYQDISGRGSGTRILLEGTPEEAKPPRVEERRVIYTSKIKVQGTVPPVTYASEFWRERIEAQTFADNTIEFQGPPGGLPRGMFRVDTEPTTSPRFVEGSE
jgi:hypothetical protein